MAHFGKLLFFLNLSHKRKKKDCCKCEPSLCFLDRVQYRPLRWALQISSFIISLK